MRYYLCELVVKNDSDIGDYFVSSISNHVSRWDDIDARALPENQAGHMFSSCNPTDIEHTAIQSDPKIIYLPIEDAGGNPVTGQLTQVPALKRTELFTLLEANGVPANGIPAVATTEELINVIKRRFHLRQMLRDNDFTENLDADISTMAQGKRDAIGVKLTSLGFNPNLTGSVRQTLRNLIDSNHRNGY